MPQTVEFEGQQYEFPDDATDTEIASMLGGQSPQQGFDESGFAGPIDTDAAVVRGQRGNLNVGVQGAGAGAAELAGFLPDMTNTAVNAGLAGADWLSQKVGGPEIGYRFPLASDELKKTATGIGEAAGVTTTPESMMTDAEKLAYNVNRFGTQAAISAPTLARAAITRAPEIAAGAVGTRMDNLLRPYMGPSAGRTIAGDLAAGAGAGAGVTIADEYAPDSPLASAGGALAGGVGGAGVLGVAEALVRGLGALLRRVTGFDVDPNVTARMREGNPMRPPVKSGTVDRAADIMQGAATSPQARERMVQNQRELSPYMENLPSPAALSEDPGLAAVENRVRLQNPAHAVDQNRNFQTSVRDTVDSVGPRGATAAPLQQTATARADELVGAQERRVASAERGGAAVENIRQRQAQPVIARRGREAEASTTLHREIVDEGYRPARAAKNEAFDAIDPEGTVQVDATPAIEAAQRVRAAVNELGPQREQLPAEFVQALERLAPDIQQQPSAILDPSGRPVMRDTNVGGPGTAALGDLVDVRKYLSTASERAATAGNFDLADNIRNLRVAINGIVEQAPEAAEATRRYGEFAETYRPRGQSEMAKFTRSIDRRQEPPPSQTAGRFMRPDRPEASAELRAAVDAAANPEAARTAATEYLIADMARSGAVGPNGTLRAANLRRWSEKNAANLDVVPGLRDEVTVMVAQAGRGQEVAGRIADTLRTRQRDLRNTQREVDRGALGTVMQADPDKAVAAIMNNPTSSARQLRELIDLTANNPAARDGLKAAARDYLIDKATTTATEKLRAGDRRGPVSAAKMSKLLNEHERELALIFDGPGEMNTLRAGHRALELANIDQLRATVGSDTAEKIKWTNIVDDLRDTPIGRGLEAALRLKLGAVYAGGKIAGIRRGLAGVGKKEQQELIAIVEEAAFDPELMGLLLGRKLRVGSPEWNSRLNTRLGLGEGARGLSEDE